MRRATLVFALSALVAIVGIVPAAHAVGTPDESLPDVWSGVWPAQLMDPKGNTPLGTLTWRQIRYEEGMALVDKNFGGRPFTGCPADGKTRFFRGSYVEGGDLVACTRGDDARVLVGRFNGREDFRSGSFEIRIMAEGPRLFVGEYFEDGGITTLWCGVLERPLVAPDPAVSPLDTAAPALKIVTGGGKLRPGKPFAFQLKARDASPSVRVDVSVIAGTKALTRLTLPVVPADGVPSTIRWNVPRGLKGPLRVCAAAMDEHGNTSRRTCMPLFLPRA
jgi:hypothetical protein